MILIVFLLLAALSAGTGYALLVWSMKWDGIGSLSLRSGASFFVGIAFNISSVRILSAILGRSDMAVVITLLLSFCIFLTFRKQLWGFIHELRQEKLFKYVRISSLLFIPVILFFWLPNNRYISDPFAIFGSLHSVRYAWIANYINECGAVPVLGQNTGQSILTFMAGWIFQKAPYAYLFFWLVSSILFLGIFFFGVVSLYERRTRLVFFSVAVLLMGNSALSLTHVLTIDSGSPFALNGYTDTLLGVFSILMLFLIHASLNGLKTKQMPLFVLASIICISNFFSAPQNLLYLFAFMPVLIISARVSNNSMGAPFFWASVLMVSALIAIPLGGMLTPKSMQVALDVPGLMTTAGVKAEQHHAGLMFVPGVPFHFGWSGADWKAGQLSFIKEGQVYMMGWQKNFAAFIWILEQMFITSIRVLFFPIIGIIGFFFLSKWQLKTPEIEQNSENAPSFKLLGLSAAYLFFIGFFINFTIMLNGYKWELSRFLIPGVTMGMLGFSLYAAKSMSNNRKYGGYLLVAILCFVTCGPLLSFLISSAVNYQHAFRDNSGAGIFQIFLGKGPEINTAFCKK
ncbi:hypothetical protein ACO0LM_00310 [Undibacterium sp. Di26W]|uniref:hypothetical protein n=1 Tax=Undibacterium sp. Di26W TaxID=3413035 RepID=UPI003BF2013C